MYLFTLIKFRKFINWYCSRAYFAKICSLGSSRSLRHNHNASLQGIHFMVEFSSGKALGSGLHTIDTVK